MGGRSALLINCSEKEARKIHEQAALQRRGVSSYVLNIVSRAVEFDDRIFAAINGLPGSKIRRLPGPRTTLLLRCSVEEAKRIRTAAKRRQTTISGFVLQALRRSWKVAEALPRPPEFP